VTREAGGDHRRAQCRVSLHVWRIQVGSSGSRWLRMNNTYGAVWEASGFSSAPYDLRITNDAQQQLIAL
jgi:Expansin C-terminal domain